MPIDAGMCSLCFGHIYDGEYWRDPMGTKWDTHIWCHLMDRAMSARKTAAAIREFNNQPRIQD